MEVGGGKRATDRIATGLFRKVEEPFPRDKSLGGRSKIKVRPENVFSGFTRWRKRKLGEKEN